MKADAASLAIAGLVPLTTVDWPGHLAACVFLQGCPLACPYCQNATLIDPHTPGTSTWDQILSFLGRRRGLLDGVVFTGGEATRQGGLLEACQQVRALGFRAALHTSGAYTSAFARVLPELSWVGLDVKALREDYPAQVGVPSAKIGESVYESLTLLLESGVPYEVRTTVYPGAPVSEHFEELITQLRAAGVEHFALQNARTQGCTPSFIAEASHWDQDAWARRFAHMKETVAQAGFASFEIR